MRTSTRVSSRHWPIIALAGALLLAAGAAPAADDVKIGALMPMTGALAEYGESSLNGVKLAEKHINANGGLLGGRVKVVVGDTQTNPQAGVAAAKQLVSANQVVGIVGALSSGVTIPVSKSVTAPSRVPQISSASTAPTITGLDDQDFLFRTTPHDALQGVVLGDIVDENGLKNVAIIYVNNDYGKGLADAFVGRYTGLGGTVSAALAYEEKQASYRGELSQAAKGGAEALVLIAYPGDGIPILKQSLEEGHFNQFILTDGMKSTDTIKAIGAEHLNGTIGTAPEAIANSASQRLFREAYEAEFGGPPSKPFIDTAYDAAFVLAMAIEKAGSTDPVKVRDALRSVANPPGQVILPGEWAKAKKTIMAGEDVDYVGAAGSQNFDKAGDVPGTFGVWTIENGEIKTLRIVGPK